MQRVNQNSRKAYQPRAGSSTDSQVEEETGKEESILILDDWDDS